MKYTNELIECKARIFPQEVREYLEIEAEYKSRSKKPADEKAAIEERYATKKREMRELYKELSRTHVREKRNGRIVLIPYQRLAIQETYNMLLALDPRHDSTAVRAKIAKLLNSIKTGPAWYKTACHYHTGTFMYDHKYCGCSPSAALMYPGLIGFPDPKV